MTENKRFDYKVIDGVYKIADNRNVLTHDEILNILNIQNELIIWLKRMVDIEGGEITPYTMIEHMTDEKINELKKLIHKYYRDDGMTEKRYTSDIHRIYNDNEEIACADTIDDAEVIVDLLNEQEETTQRLKEIREEQIETILKLKRKIKELETEVLDLRAEVGRLNSRKQVENPHWLKYKSSKGYTKEVNQDIRFDGDVE